MPWRRSNAADAQLARDGIDGRGCPRCIQLHFAADQLVRRDAPQHDVRIRHRGLAAFAVAGRPGIGARAFRTHAQQSAFIHARDGAAARADGVNIEHRHAHRKAVDGRLQCFARLRRRTG